MTKNIGVVINYCKQFFTNYLKSKILSKYKIGIIDGFYAHIVINNVKIILMSFI